MRLTVTLFLLLMTTLAFCLPLTGSYTVGGGTANYATLTAAIAAANAQGLSAAVTFNLNPGTYAGPFVINIPGNSYVLTISSGIYDDSQVILTNPSSTYESNYILKIDQTSKVTIDDVTFSPTGTYSRCIDVQGNSDYLTFSNNRFEGVISTDTSYNQTLYFVTDGTNDEDNILISGNVFNNGGLHISLYAGSSLSNLSAWQILSNTHTGGSGISLSRASDVAIRNEIMTGVTSGIYLENGAGSLDVSRNRISASYYGIALNYVTPSTSATPHISNNIITVSASPGMQINANNVFAAHNSVLCTSSTTYQTAAFSVSGNSNIIRQNHFISTGGAYAVFASNIDPLQGSHNIIENNNLYTRAMYIANVNNASYIEIEDFNALTGTTNQSLNPFFSDELLHNTAPRLDNLYAACGVTIDYNGNPRSLTTPDIGAWEYTSNPAMTPLSGTITVGTGGTYTTMAAFAQGIGLRGMSANVTANLTNALYEEQFILEKIPGSGPGAVLTITSSTPVNAIIRFSTQDEVDSYLLKLTRTKEVIFDNITFQTLATSYSNLVLLSGYNTKLQFRYCDFIAPNNNAGASLYMPYGSNASEMFLLGSSFTGNGYGIYVSGTKWDIASCLFDNQLQGIVFTQISDAEVISNRMTNMRSAGIHINGDNGVRIIKNYIQGTGQFTGIAAYNLNPLNTDRNLIANNVIKVTGEANGSNGLTFNGNGFNILNNSILNEGNGTAFYTGGLGTGVDIVNNIFTAPLGISFDITSYTHSADKVINNNCYYGEGTYFARIGNYYSSLTAMQAAIPEINSASLNLNPFLATDIHTGSPWLRHVGANRTEINDDMDSEIRTGGFDIGADQQTGVLITTRLSGNYTIGATGCNYPTIQAFLNDINLYGINGNVNVTITAGTYAGYNQIKQYPTTSPLYKINWIAAAGCQFVLNAVNPQTDDNYFFKLQGADNVTFTGFRFSTNSATNYSSVVQLTGACDNIIFTNCTFILTTYMNTGIYPTRYSVASGLTVENCIFQNGTNGVYVGDYYNGAYYSNVRVANCTFTGTANPISITKTTNVEITGNTCTAFNNSMTLYYVDGNVSVYKNRFHATGIYSGITLVSLSNVLGTLANPVRVYDNIVTLRNSSCPNANGMSVAYSSFVTLTNNTINIENSGAASFDYGSALTIYQSPNTILQNNILSSPFSGLALNVATATDVSYWNNAFYNSGKHIAEIASVRYGVAEFISSLFTNQSGIYANPLPDANGYTKCSYLRGKGIHTTVASDIDGVAFPTNHDLGASVIPNYGTEVTGTKTVGVTGNYTDLSTAWLDLMRRGISGDVILDVQAGNYSLDADLGYVPNSLSNNLTITGTLGNSPIFNGNASTEETNGMLKLFNTRNLTLSNLAFMPQNTHYAKCLELERYTEDLTVSNCSFLLTPNSQNTTNSSAISGIGIPFTNLLFENNWISNLSYGFNLYGISNFPQYSTGLQITGNTIVNPYTGIQISYMSAPKTNENTINSFKYMGITQNNGISNAEIKENKITGNGYSGISLNGFGTTGGTQSIVNNYVQTGANVQYSVNLENVPNAKMYYNTFVNTYTGSDGAAFRQGASCSELAFMDNICKAGASSAAIFSQLFDFESQKWTHNLYYSTGIQAVKLGSTIINSSYWWNQNTGDQYSIFADPMLNGSTYELLSSSPAINAGTAISGINTDIAGSFRNTPDMGCYEYTLLTLTAPQNLQIAINNETGIISLIWNSVSGAGAYRVYMNNSPEPGAWYSTVVIATTTIGIPVSQGYKFFKVTALSSPSGK